MCVCVSLRVHVMYVCVRIYDMCICAHTLAYICECAHLLKCMYVHEHVCLYLICTCLYNYTRM